LDRNVWLNEYWPAAAAGLLPGDATGWLSRERQGMRMVRSPAGRSVLIRRGLTMAVVVACLILAPSSSGASARDASPAVRAQGGWEDPLAPMVRRTDDYLQQFEVDGVTMDWRYSVIPSEEIRQTVVCQLLAYVELSRLDPRPRLRAEILHHADFLLGRIDSIRSHTPFDGMLAYSLLGAYEISREPRYLDAGTLMMNDLLAIPTSECVLNGGLMVAMATAEYWKLTGNVQAEQKTHDILAQLVPYQNTDGSFPHWCWGSRDIHYTGWMGMELVHIGRLVSDPLIEPFLASMSAFLAGRIAPNGQAIYEEPCPGVPDCTLYYYSRATGCPQDLDSRGWTVEPAYCALLFDREGAPQYQPVMSFLDSLEVGGTIPDLYGYWPPPSDPEYPWTTADTSVVCMSINLWVLSTAIAERIERGEWRSDLVLDDLTRHGAGTVPDSTRGRTERGRSLPSTPIPAPRRMRPALLARRLREPGSLAVYDAGGRKRANAGVRRARTRGDARAAAGTGATTRAAPSPDGVYFAHLRLDHATQTRRITLLRQ
jgi:hypothetical protein